MVAYWKLRYAFKRLDKAARKAARIRTIDGLARLRQAIAERMPDRTASSTLLLGTWNIRNFDDDRFGHGSRLEESFFYLAEVISAFDIVAVQEICDDLGPFQELMNILGPGYDFIMTDVTEGPGGNRERLGFLYDRSKISFKGVAGEIVLPFSRQISDVTKERQFARTPFSCTFQSGWFKFAFATVHIYYGSNSPGSDKFKRRVKEIDAVAKFIATRARRDPVYNHILVGDFNIEDFEGETFDALARHGFEVFRNKIGSNAKKTKFYDQISFLPKHKQVALANPGSGKAHGVFDMFSVVFRDQDFTLHDPAMSAIIHARRDAADAAREKAEARLAAAATDSARERAEKDRDKAVRSIEAEERLLADRDAREAYYLNEWRTFQISDHFPLFVELKIDFADSYLERMRAEAESENVT
ncbi:endonuclease/exonuclease/phosphatase family protein [Nitratireductor arenosus]|uniref:endonuclease/exonuclease/phosphatase family protein n=1 Tax=Nitratireductor arenosus TaxID=2682096 RepID=UPI0018D21644|nr:endonuclease/exonuclease/phosphatase family protein [Nitratireductor arenosus]